MNPSPPLEPGGPIAPTSPPTNPPTTGPNGEPQNEAPVQPAPPSNPPPSTPRTPRTAKSREVDPVLAFQYSVEVTTDPFGIGMPWDIPINGFFGEISGLDVEWETAEYKSTNLIGLPHSNFMVGRPVYHPIVLKRGITNSEGFWLWHQLLSLGTKPLLKRYVLITMYNRSYEPVVQWSVERAFPTKISGPQMRADSNDIVIEELTLTHGGVQRMYLNPAFMLIDVGIQLLLP